jgi:hypothetical protein
MKRLPLDLSSCVIAFCDDTTIGILRITGLTDKKTDMKVSEICTVDLLEYALSIGCPTRNLTTCLAFGGHLDCLRYAHEHGCEWNSKTCENAASGGHLDCLEYAHESDCNWDHETCSAAAENGHLDCLKYAHEHGCEWNSKTCKYAARNGHLDCLKYAHEQGCEWNHDTCLFAARNGHLECLMYAHEQGCEWDRMTCSAAARNGHLECLEYAREHGCEWNSDAYMCAIEMDTWIVSGMHTSKAVNKTIRCVDFKNGVRIYHFINVIHKLKK